VVLVPADMEGLRIEPRNFTGEYEQTRAGNLVVHRWEVRNSPKLSEEFNMPTAKEVLPTVRIESPRTWEDIYAAGRRIDADARITPPIRSRTAEVLEGVEGDLEQAQALYRFVNDLVEQDAAENPTVTLLAGQGSRVDLFVAMARSAGLQVSYIEVGPNPLVEPPIRYEFPEDVFNPSPVVQLAHPGGSTYLDFSSRYMPWGVVSHQLGGSLSLLHGPVETRLVMLPEREIPATLGIHHAEMRVSAGGTVAVSGEIEWPPAIGAQVKRAFESLDAQVHRLAVSRMLASNYYKGFDLEEFELLGLEDMEAPMRLRFSGRSQQLLVSEGSGQYLVPTGFQGLGLQAGLIRESDRQLDYVSMIRIAGTSQVAVTLEPGVELVGVPATSCFLSELGSYRLAFRRESGSACSARRDFQLRPGRLSPEEYPAFVEFCRDSDRAERGGFRIRLPQ
jgi:hypothetical protein